MYTSTYKYIHSDIHMATHSCVHMNVLNQTHFNRQLLIQTYAHICIYVYIHSSVHTFEHTWTYSRIYILKPFHLFKGTLFLQQNPRHAINEYVRALSEHLLNLAEHFLLLTLNRVQRMATYTVTKFVSANITNLVTLYRRLLSATSP